MFLQVRFHKRLRFNEYILLIPERCIWVHSKLSSKE